MKIQIIKETNGHDYYRTYTSGVPFTRSARLTTSAAFIEKAKEFYTLKETHDKAYKTVGISRFGSINQRCGKYTSSTSSQFKAYRDKNIQIKMTQKEFMSWWMSQKETYYTLLGQNEIPSIDRIDNKGHYELGNLQLISLHENLEKRSGKPCKRQTTEEKEKAKEHNRKNYLKAQKDQNNEN